MQTRPTQGFTLVELIVTMVVLGILALGSTRFLTDSASGYVATNNRTQLANQARLTLNRLVRDVREALPGSLRVRNTCLELIPTQYASRYVTLPVASGASSFLAAALPTGSALATDSRAAVLPGVNLYQLSASSTVSSGVTLSTPDVQNQITVTLDAPHQFPTLSPRSRVYFVGAPRSYCVDGGNLWRYQNYGYVDPQPTLVTLPAAAPGRSLFAQNAQVLFTLDAPTLTRSAALQIDLTLSAAGDSVRLQHLAQVRNVP